MRFLALLLALSAQEAEAPVELRALETFDAAWSIIDTEHFDPSFHGVDWQAVRTELRPRAASAAARAEVRGTISAMLARLGQSHFQLIPEETLGASAPGSPGAELSPPSAPRSSSQTSESAPQQQYRSWLRYRRRQWFHRERREVRGDEQMARLPLVGRPVLTGESRGREPDIGDQHPRQQTCQCARQRPEVVGVNLHNVSPRQCREQRHVEHLWSTPRRRGERDSGKRRLRRR